MANYGNMNPQGVNWGSGFSPSAQQPPSGLSAAIGAAGGGGYTSAQPGASGYDQSLNQLEGQLSEGWGTGTQGGQNDVLQTEQAGLPVYQQQLQQAGALQRDYLQQAQAGLGIAGPTIADLGQQGAAAGLGQTAANLGQVAQGFSQIPSTAQAQLESGLGQSLNANLALARSAQGGAVGQAGAMRQAQQQNAQQGAGLAGQSAILAAQEQQAALAGQQGALGAQAGVLGQQGGLEYQQAAQQAALAQQQQAQNENYSNSLVNFGTQQEQLAAQQLNAQQGEGIQAGLGISGVGINQQNANSTTLSSYAPYIGAGLSAAAALL